MVGFCHKIKPRQTQEIVEKLSHLTVILDKVINIEIDCRVGPGHDLGSKIFGPTKIPEVWVDVGVN